MKLEQTFFVGAFDVDDEKKITNAALLEILSDMSMLHGAVSGQTKTDRKSDISWVVLGWRMKVYRRPNMFSTLRAVTWARDHNKVRACRDYIIYDEDDNIVAKATAEWVALDVATGRFLRITPELVAPFDPEPENIVFPDYTCPSIRHLDVEPQISDEMEINRMMFDYNGHVHNCVYQNLAEQILPEELFRRRFNEVVILYKLEITNQEKVLLEYSVEEDRHIVSIRQKSDGKLHAIVIMSDIE